LTDSSLRNTAPYEPFELDHGLLISSSIRLQHETLSYRVPAASSACHIDHIEQSCLLDSLESIPRMTCSGFYLVHLLRLCSGLVGHSQCSTLARNPSNANMTEGILTQPSLQCLKLGECVVDRPTISVTVISQLTPYLAIQVVNNLHECLV
jgi:hypothetical protein